MVFHYQDHMSKLLFLSLKHIAQLYYSDNTMSTLLGMSDNDTSVFAICNETMQTYNVILCPDLIESKLITKKFISSTKANKIK